MTTVRSAISATTPMSWVMKATDMPSSSCSSLMSSRISAWIVTSSAVVGSSAIRSFGLQARAIEAAMVDQGFGDLEAERQYRVEAGHRLLKDHRYQVAAHMAHLVFGYL